ncbi:MAG: glycosyltransferase family 39 protein, partial [Halobacteriales archaeon]|nr:glycosyltransferase family 39 protein [Halobacteriales archaeon]
PDAFRYAAMGHPLSEHDAFWMLLGNTYSHRTPDARRHYPSPYPAVLAASYKVFGFSEWTTRLVSLALSLAAVAVAYACTRDLYGKGKGLVAAAVIALDPVLVMTTDKVYSENLLLVTFIVALWAIQRSLDRPWFIVVGALFAGLGYLTKSSLGTFFLVAGLGGLAWRLHWRGLRVLRDPAYLTGIALFGTIVVAWAWRNWRLFGDWQTSAHIQAAYRNALAHPGDWALLLLFSTLVMVGLGYLLYMAALPWLPQLARIPKLADEHDSGLWLAFLLPIVLTIPIDSALWLYEGDFYLHNVRYVAFAIVPLLWLLLRHVTLTKSAWAAILASFAILLAGSAYYALPNRPFVNDVADRVGPLVHDGDSVTFVDWEDVYRFYFDLTDDGHRDVNVHVVNGTAAHGLTTTWAIVHGDGQAIDPAVYRQESDMRKGSDEWTLWRIR